MTALWGMREPTAPATMTAEELWQDRRFATGYELIEGRLVKMSPAGYLHGEIVQELSRVIGNFVKPHQLGTVAAAETGFVVSQPGQPDTVLAPEIAFVRADRLPPRNSPERKKYLRLAPDLVVEVVSPDQFRSDVTSKAQFWLQIGVRLFWVAWPDAQTIDVWRPNVAMQTLTSAEALNGDEVLPGFTQPVGELF